jgi:hypothetical protein
MTVSLPWSYDRETQEHSALVGPYVYAIYFDRRRRVYGMVGRHTGSRGAYGLQGEAPTLAAAKKACAAHAEREGLLRKTNRGRRSNPRARAYVGYKAGGVYEAFTSPTKPTTASHGQRYLSALGPFSTLAAAKKYAQVTNEGGEFATVASFEKWYKRFRGARG